MQCQDIGNRFAGMLLNQGVVAFRQQTAVKDFPNLRNPTNMETVKDTGFNLCPVVHRHGHVL
jgi:hypothetical protein